MKFLEILLSFFSTQGKAFLQTNTEALTQHIVNNARKVAILLSCLVVSITLFCTGFSMAFTGIVNSYANNEGFSFSAHVVGGLTLCVLAGIALTQCLSEKNWLRATGVAAAPLASQAAQAAQQGPSLDTAFAVLILEIASELKERRHNDSANQGETPQV